MLLALLLNMLAMGFIKQCKIKLKIKVPNEKVGLTNGNFEDKFKQQHSSVREKQMSSSQEDINLSVFFSFLLS